MFLYIDGGIVKESEAAVSPASPGFLYGYGVFETLKVLNGQPCFVSQHLDRLRNSCRALKLEWTVEEHALFEDMKKLLKYNAIEEGRIRINCFKKHQSTGILMECSRQSYALDLYKSGISLGCSTIRRNPLSLLCSHKSMNYMENLLAREEASGRGFNEALMLNLYDCVCEGSVSNVFWVSSNVVYTPSLDCGILPGTVRALVLDLCRKEGIEARQGSFSLDELYEADEVFATNAVMGIMPVRSIESKVYDVGANTTCRLLMKNYRELLHESCGW